MTACWQRGKSVSASILLKGFRLQRAARSTASNLMPGARAARGTEKAADTSLHSLECLARSRYKQTEAPGKVDDKSFEWKGQRSSMACVCDGGACIVVHSQNKCRHSAGYENKRKYLSQMLALIDCAAACSSTK